MDLELAGKVIAVAGASRGVCFSIAAQLAREGADIALAARSSAALAEAHAAIERQGGRCFAFGCDLSVPGEASAFVRAAHEVFGRLDGLVCNGALGLRADIPRQGWPERTLSTGYVIEAIEAAAPIMPEGGSIVLVAAGAGHWPAAASRAVLGEAARYFSREQAERQVRVNMLVPRGPAFAGRAVFLLSPRSAGIAVATDDKP